MPLSPPLDQFADRLIRNGELRTFIQGLIERGVTTKQLLAAMKPTDLGPANDEAMLRWQHDILTQLQHLIGSRDVAGLDHFMKTHVPMKPYGDTSKNPFFKG